MVRSLAPAAALAASTLGAEALAQGYPTKPVRLVVGFAPGGAADTVGRALADGLGKALGSPWSSRTAPAQARRSRRTASPSPRPGATAS